MRSTILTIAGMLLFSASTAQAEIPWNADLRAAHQQATQEGKLLLLHFYTDNCHWCDKLETGAFQSDQVSAAIGEHYVPVKIHAGKNPTLAKTFKVSRFPTDVIASTDGSVLAHGVSPQAAQDYVGMLARYSGKAPAAANPMSPNYPTGTQIANAPAEGFAPVHVPAPQPNSPVAPYGAAAQPFGGPTPQINQFAIAAQRPVQANTYAPQTNAYASQANTYAPQVPNPSPPQGFAVPQPQFQSLAPPPSAQLSLPTGNLAAAPQAAAAPTAQTTFSLPPGTQMGTPAAAVGHRTNGMTLSQPAQVPTPEACCNDASCNDASCAVNAAAQPVANVAPANEPPPLAMQGYCPVAVLDQGEWVAGDPQNGLIHLGQLYLFSSPAAMEKFRNTPEVYTPVMNGMDVVLFFQERRLVPGSREWGMTDPEFNRMFFFANEETMNHFNQEHSRYTRAAIDITRQAAIEANATTR